MTNLTELQRFFQALRSVGVESALTTDAIKNQNGAFVSNRNTPPALSPNAQFGGYLAKHQKELNICYSGTVPTRDANGHRTRSAVWEILP